MNDAYRSVIHANQQLHGALAHAYNTSEPHFRPENVAHVERKLQKLFSETAALRMLDLGCGTGFVIDIAKKYVKKIDGVDVTQDMLDRVELTRRAEVRLALADSR